MVAGLTIGLLKLHSLPDYDDGYMLWFIIVIATSVLGTLILVAEIIALSCWLRRKKPMKFEQVEAFLELHEKRATKRYKYSDVKKMTNFFKDKLGEGGYGSVFKGILPNGGVMVAVKKLSETRGNGDDFINELASISKTFHINLVTYLGYCVDRGRRALIYEFMPKGSLEKYIYYKVSVGAQSRLGLMTLYNIAIGIADGLQYLHGGCPNRILHLDIKPSNILLDNECIPKISDFGLAKLCAGNRSTVSLEGARVSRKADVYSYGKMLLEMAGGRKIFDVETEIYYPPWIYDRLVSNGNLELYGITTPEEEQTARKMILVGLWCVQTDPAVRPQMSEVVQMLKGSLQTLQIPSRPASI
ncbi:hypothetical protein AQUCO_02200131v1 [Aquilegia coerulea]|uniref:non-specific serine/threonine protein kinase n=1 Tax=Aquilegia coerulea TaxID=218851 RepID=A0A2G5DE37_AQUCA|nr:hypothetical protein AQUCO_02200131v1 [Aquilegia coerulea]